MFKSIFRKLFKRKNNKITDDLERIYANTVAAKYYIGPEHPEVVAAIYDTAITAISYMVDCYEFNIVDNEVIRSLTAEHILLRGGFYDEIVWDRSE